MNMKKKAWMPAVLSICLALESFASLGPLKADAAKKPVYRNVLRTEKGKRYYYTAKGKRLKNAWRTVKGKRYYFTKSGAAAVGLRRISGKTYLFSSQGVLKRGWQTVHKKRRYFSAKSGAMLTGFHWIAKKLYYFDKAGVLQKNRWVGDRYLGAKGAWEQDRKRLGPLKERLQAAASSYSGSWSVYVKNLDTGESILINNRHTVSASLIKLYAMAAAYDRIQAGSLPEETVYGTLRSMIIYSDNGSFNRVVRSIGLSAVNAWCRKNGYLDTNQGQGISDPSMANGSGYNITTAQNCGRLLEEIYRGTCVSASASARMLELLKQQTWRHKIPAGVPAGVTVANKTGETADVTHDAAIVYSPKATYVLCVLGDTKGIGFFSAYHITEISRMVYEYLND